MESLGQDEEFIIPKNYSELTESTEDLRRYVVDHVTEFESLTEVTQTLNSIEGWYSFLLKFLFH